MKVQRLTAATTNSKLAVTKRGGKKVRDPNKPKRSLSAFLLFMDGFRKEFKEKNPDNKLVSVVSKAGGDKWKSMSDSEKAPFVAKAEKLKAEYLKIMEAYNRGETMNGGAEGEESDKSKSEVNDGDAEEDDE
ncbi:HMG1/2-like protein [Asparagus officinalis]|uniref:HMG1/2-like protein n=1 Tax=Asparagus officinalis TaxID=4686 RepID=UPI00098E6730|nr:HMG1/2-like protein [Asparagus officinalis]